MLSRRKSRGFLLDVSSSGAAFVDTLQQVGYPKAGALSGPDFDWLFDLAEAERFLEWFCHAGPALEEVLRTCRGPLRLKGWQPAQEEEEEEEKPLEALEEELRQLLGTRDLLVRNRNKLQVRASELRHRQCRLSAEEELAGRALRQARGALEEEGVKLDAALQQCRQEAGQLAPHYSREEGTPGSLPPLMSGLALEPYAELEESGAGEAVRRAGEEMRGLLESPAREAPERGGAEREEALREELRRLRLCHVGGQRELLSLRVQLQSSRAGLQWAEREKVLAGTEDPSGRVLWLSAQVPALERDLERLKAEMLPSLLRESAHCFSLPVLHGDLDAEGRRLRGVSSLQERVAGRLLGQQARQEVLGLALQMEMRDHRLAAGPLEELHRMLSGHVRALQDRLTLYGDPKLSSRQASRVRIAAQDQTSVKLWQMLDDPPAQKQLFQKYDSLCVRGRWLNQEVMGLQAKVVEGVPHIPALERDCETFHSLLYGDSKRLALSAQELSEALEEVVPAVSQLNQTLMDILADLKGKARSLLDPRRRQERSLYALFFREPARLKEEVEALERRAREFSEALV
ncbi:HAUS augmin-like complex subunit 3 [Rhinatrema bivittatum]|uniref:HAUS augmin-like complex subunit 3 n=1 Tax=Rhinatrema bivittatum TaxID=194408 RepID=UPI00112D22DC|nr:HAUS augmin-like complex subunit 3 [Rhinatrema bivittatum]